MVVNIFIKSGVKWGNCFANGQKLLIGHIYSHKKIAPCNQSAMKY